jgi:hypothetical protein
VRSRCWPPTFLTISLAPCWFEGAPKVTVNTGPARFAVVTLSKNHETLSDDREPYAPGWHGPQALLNPGADASATAATFDGGHLDVAYRCIDCYDAEVVEFVQATFRQFPEFQMIEVTGGSGFQVTFTRAPATELSGPGACVADSTVVTCTTSYATRSPPH